MTPAVARGGDRCGVLERVDSADGDGPGGQRGDLGRRQRADMEQDAATRRARHDVGPSSGHRVIGHAGESP